MADYSNASAAAGEGEISGVKHPLTGRSKIIQDNSVSSCPVSGAGDNDEELAKLQSHYEALYEKFKVLEDKYEASKKAMNDVLWKVLPTYTEDFNQLPPMTNLPSIETTIYLGDYEILEIIGEGRFAAVRACRYHPPTPRRSSTSPRHSGGPMTLKAADLPSLCIKTLNKSIIKDHRRCRRMHQEVEALRLLAQDKPAHILYLYDVLHSKDHLHLITERMERDLFEYCHRRPHQSEQETCILILQIMEGMRFCHARNVAHRDLKPENVLISYRNRKVPLIRIGDFGLSLVVKEIPVEKEMVGSPGFLPPDVLSPGTYDPFIGDVWSIGCILLELAMENADAFKKHWMKPYECIHEYPEFEERMRTSLQFLQSDLKQRLPEGLHSLLFEMLTYDSSLRPPISELITRDWIVANSQGYEPETSTQPSFSQLASPPTSPKNVKFSQTFSSLAASMAPAPLYKNPRTRIDAITKKSFAHLAIVTEQADDQQTPSEQDGITGNYVSDGAEGQDGEQDKERQEKERANSPRTPTRGGVTHPRHFFKDLKKISPFQES